MFISQNADLCRDGDRPIVLLVPPRQAADVTPVLNHLVHVGRGQLANVLRYTRMNVIKMVNYFFNVLA